MPISPVTYNQIIQASRAFQQAHFGLKNFGNGQPFDIAMHNQTAAEKYPLMWMEDLDMPIQEGVEVFAFRTYFMGTVATVKDKDTDLLSTNANEVKSDMMQCAKDFLSYWVQDHNYDTLSVEKSGARITFEDKIEDRLTGCYLDIRFRQAFNYNSCIIPMSGTTPPASTCAPVFIYENLILVDTVASGGSYSYTTSAGSIGIDFNGVATGVDLTADPSDFNVVDSAAANVGTLTTNTASEKKVVVADSTVEIKDTAGAILHTKVVKAEATTSQTITDSTVNIKDSAGTLLYGQTVKAEDNINRTINDSTFSVNAVSKAGTLAEGSKAVTIVDQNDNTLTVTDVTNTKPIFKGSVSLIGSGNPFKTGQTVSFATGDDGDEERGNGASFFTLSHNNPYGNTTRFLDELGTAVFTNNIVIDWSTANYATQKVLGWERVFRGPATWATTMAAQVTGITVAGFTLWKIPNIKEMASLGNWDTGLTCPINFSPISLDISSTAHRPWLSTTNETTTSAYILVETGALNLFVKTSSTRYFVCRYFTFTPAGVLT